MESGDFNFLQTTTTYLLQAQSLDDVSYGVIFCEYFFSFSFRIILEKNSQNTYADKHFKWKN